MSFYTSLTGLNAATAALSVTSNNIANTGTTGFKRSRADFGDIFATSPLQRASSVIGQGVSLKQVTQEFSQGNIQFSASSLDLAITGDGFFPLKSADGLQDIYTRNGTFLLDDSFAVVNSAGQFLEAALVDSNGKADLENLKKLIIPRSTTGDAQATSLVELALNLPAEGEVITQAFDKDNPETYNLTTSVTVFDAGGNEYLATVYYAKTKRASPDDPTNKWQTHVFIGDTKLNELLIQATDQKGERLYVNKYGEIRSENGSPPIPPEDIARGVTKLFNLDDLKDLQPSVPATASGSPLTEGLVATWKNGFNIPEQLQTVLNESPIEGQTYRSPITFALNVDGSAEPVIVDLSYLNEPGASLTEAYTGVEIAREMNNAINKAYGDERYFDLSSLKATDTATSVDLFELSVSTDGATPSDDDKLVVSLSETRTGADPAFGSFLRLSEIRTEDAVDAIQAQINENAFELGLIGSEALAAANQFSSLASVANGNGVTLGTLIDLDGVAPAGTGVLEVELARLRELDEVALDIATEAAANERSEQQQITFSAPSPAISAGTTKTITFGGSTVTLESTDTTATLVATKVAAALTADRFGAVPEIQTISFSDPTLTTGGNITVGGYTVAIASGVDSAEDVATAVTEALRASDFVGEKQKVEFSAVTTTGSITVAGVTVALTAGQTAIQVAAAVKTALDANATFNQKIVGGVVTDNLNGTLEINYLRSQGDADDLSFAAAATGVTANIRTVREFEERTIVDNGDGSITISFAKDDDNAAPIVTADPALGITGAVNVDQAYAAPSVTNNSDGSITITYLDDSKDAAPLSFVDTGTSGVSAEVATIRSYRENIGEKQTLQFTDPTVSGASLAGKSITVAGVTVTLTASDTTKEAVATKVAQALRSNVFITANPGRSVTDNLDGSISIQYSLDDGDIEDTAFADAGSTGVRATISIDNEYANTDDLSEKQLAQGVAEAIAPLQMAAKLLLDEKATKAEILAAIEAAADEQAVGSPYYDSVAATLLAAQTEAARASSSALTVYEAVLRQANGPQRAAIEAYSSRSATKATVLDAITNAQTNAVTETNALIAEVTSRLNLGTFTLEEIQTYISEQSDAYTSDSNTKISRADSFRAIEVAYDAVNGSFSFNGRSNDQLFLGSASSGRNELFGLELVPTAVDADTGLYGSVVYPNGDEILDRDQQRYGIKVTFNDTDRTFDISSGRTGDESSVKISDASALANLLFGFTTVASDEVIAAATGASPVVQTSDVPVRGIDSQPAVLTGNPIGINLDNKFAVDARNDTFVVTVDNVTGLIQMPRKADYNIEEFRDLLERRINSLSDRFGRTVNGVRVEVITNPVTNTKSFQFTTGTAGDASFLKVSGPTVWGLSDLESARGTTSEWIEPIQATDAEGFPLYVDRDGNETTDAGDFSEEESRDLWAPIFLDKGELTFNTAGQLTSPLSEIRFKDETIGTSGATLGIAIDYAGSTQFSNPFSVLAQNQDGRPEGDLIGLDIGDDGLVSANYSNGSQKNLAKIVLANFSNPTGLRQIGDASYYATSKSGAVSLGEAGTAGFGTVRAGARERANVDLTQELIELITNQRNFQANAKAIETNNTLTQAIINIRS
jgi:flagellar hook-basal body protein